MHVPGHLATPNGVLELQDLSKGWDCHMLSEACSEIVFLCLYLHAKFQYQPINQVKVAEVVNERVSLGVRLWGDHMIFILCAYVNKVLSLSHKS